MLKTRLQQGVPEMIGLVADTHGLDNLRKVQEATKVALAGIIREVGHAIDHGNQTLGIAAVEVLPVSTLRGAQAHSPAASSPSSGPV